MHALDQLHALIKMSFIMSLDTLNNVLNSTAQIAAQGAVSIAGASKSAKENYKYQRKLTDYQNQLAIANWNRQNDYNSPINQVSRLRAAGVNPALAYGSTSLQNVSSDIDGASVPSFSGYNLNVPDVVSIQAQNAQMKLLEQQAKGVGYDNMLKAIDAVIALNHQGDRERGYVGRQMADAASGLAADLDNQVKQENISGMQYDNAYKAENYQLDLEAKRFANKINQMSISDASKSDLISAMERVAALSSVDASTKNHLAQIKYGAVHAALESIQTKLSHENYKYISGSLMKSVENSKSPLDIFKSIASFLERWLTHKAIGL